MVNICTRCTAGDHRHDTDPDGRVVECPFQGIPGDIDVVCDCTWRPTADDLPAVGVTSALQAVVDEYETTGVNPAPYTSERALYERICHALGRDPTPAP